MIQEYLDLAVSAVNPVNAKDVGDHKYSDGKKVQPIALPILEAKPVDIFEEAVVVEPEGSLASRFAAFVAGRFSETSVGRLVTKDDEDEFMFSQEEIELTDEMVVPEEKQEPDEQATSKQSATEMSQSPMYEDVEVTFDEPEDFSLLMDEASFYGLIEAKPKVKVEDSMLLSEVNANHAFDRDVPNREHEDLGEDMKKLEPVNDFDGIVSDFSIEENEVSLHYGQSADEDVKPANDPGHNIHLAADDVLDLGNNLFITGDSLDFIEFTDPGWDKLSEPMELSGDIDTSHGYDTYVHESGAIVHVEHLISTNFESPETV